MHMLIYEEKKKKTEKGVIAKYEDQPKLFFRYVKGKLRDKHEVEKLYRNSEEYVEDLEMVEIMNEHFQEVFTRERNWNEEEILEINSPSLSEINVSKQEIMNQLKELYVSKPHGPD